MLDAGVVLLAPFQSWSRYNKVWYLGWVARFRTCSTALRAHSVGNSHEPVRNVIVSSAWTIARPAATSLARITNTCSAAWHNWWWWITRTSGLRIFRKVLDAIFRKVWVADFKNVGAAIISIRLFIRRSRLRVDNKTWCRWTIFHIVAQT